MFDLILGAVELTKSYHWVDLSVIATYVLLTIGIGLWVRKRASKNLDSYFLGSRQMPWYILGVSQAAGMFDITGTMWLVSILFIYGMKSIYIPFMYPWFIHVFYMVYMAAWVRRSNVMTGAEWIRTRFGNDRGSELSQLSVVAFALIATIAMLVYACKGIGKFAIVFLPESITLFDHTIQMTPNYYAMLIMGITSLYVIIGGFHSVALTSVVQFIIMTIAAVIVAVIAMINVSPEALAEVVPNGWQDVMLSWKMNLDWTGTWASLQGKISEDAYELLGLFLMMMMCKSWLVSMAGPVPNYDLQRILATKNPREASLTYWFVSIVVLIPRYLMVAAIAVLALVSIKDPSILPTVAGKGYPDTEAVLPIVLNKFIPMGLFGLLMAELLAAFMSTFAATLNAGAVYVVNDIYKKYINPDGSEKTYVRASYIVTFLLLATGLALGFIVESIDQVTAWVFAGLWVGYISANVLKWYWWRLNGIGYFCGMVSGIGVAIAYSAVSFLLDSKFGIKVPGWVTVYLALIIIPISTLASVVGSLLSKPEDDATLMSFYKQVRPWGFWKPVHDKVIAADPDFKRNTNFKRDMVNIAVGIVWQTTLTIFPCFLVIQEWKAMWLTLGVTLVTSIFLKFNWYDKLESD